MEKRNKTKKQKPLDDIIVMVSLCLFLSAVAVKLVWQYDAYLKIKQEQQEILKQIEQAKEQTAEHQNQKEYYASDAYIEKIAREQLGLIKSNEVLYVNRAK